MPHIRSLYGKVQSRVNAARCVDRPLAYLVNEAIVYGFSRFNPVVLTSRYAVNGRSVTLNHGTDNTFVFREVFVQGIYAPPPEVLGVLQDRKLRVLDLGGNIGLFTLWASIHLPVVSLRAFEPDPENAARYRRLLSENDLTWDLTEAVAGNVNGTARFSAKGLGTSSLSFDSSGIVVESIDVVPLLDQVDLLKMDIEGGEWAILTDHRFLKASVPAIVMEYHPDHCPEKDPVQMAVQCLNAAGFSIHHVGRSENGVGILWAYKPTAPRLEDSLET